MTDQTEEKLYHCRNVKPVMDSSQGVARKHQSLPVKRHLNIDEIEFDGFSLQISKDL